MARQGEGFIYPGGEWLHVGEFTPPLRPFLLWNASCNKEVRRASAQIWMQGIKDYLKAKEARKVKEEGGTSSPSRVISSNIMEVEGEKVAEALSKVILQAELSGQI
ncbi:hypothetical protein SUGI_0404390 [Cryptomeria japonica]|nr:hypothetical protein SUGI_0404390 [Cryptomeria japonica]